MNGDFQLKSSEKVVISSFAQNSDFWATTRPEIVTITISLT